MSLWGLDYFVNLIKGQVTSTSMAGWTSAFVQPECPNPLVLESFDSLCPLAGACVHLISKTIASAPMEVGKEINGEWQPEIDSEYLRFFYNHPKYSYIDLIERIVLSMELTGVAYIENASKYIWPWRTSDVLVKLEQNQIGVEQYKIGGKKEISPDNMIVIGFQSLSGYNNFYSPTASIFRQLYLDNKSYETLQEYFSNRDTCGGVVQVKEQYTEAQKKSYYEREIKNVNHMENQLLRELLKEIITNQQLLNLISLNSGQI